VLLALAACGSPQERSPHLSSVRRGIGGTLDTGDPAVVGMADSRGFVDCTGTIVDATHVVTAGHCVFDVNNRPYVYPYVFICSDSNGIDPTTQPACYLDVFDNKPHPLFSVTSVDLANDIAVATLTTPTSIPPMPLPKGPLPSSAVNTTVRNVGYGINNEPRNTGGGIKRTGPSTLTFLGPRAPGTTAPNPDGLVSGTLQMTESPAGTCSGDSGGPALWPTGAGQTEQLVGVTSWGDNLCNSFGVDTMVGSYLCWLRSMGVTTAECPDAGALPDAGATRDAGTSLDAGSSPDSGLKPDAGVVPDAGRQDTGGTPDAGTLPDAGGGDAPKGWCGCTSSGNAPLFASVAFLFRRRRPRTTQQGR
jgi:hypothetical protein